MLNVESTLWRVEAFNAAYAHITQKASGVIRTVMRCELPSALASYPEQRFNSVLREAFHKAAK